MKSIPAACFIVMLAVAASAQAAQRAGADSGYPARPIRLIVPQAPGGSNDITAFLNLPETRKRFTDEGAEVEIRTPDEVRRMIPAEIAKWTKVARAAGMRVEQ